MSENFTVEVDDGTGGSTEISFPGYYYNDSRYGTMRVILPKGKWATEKGTELAVLIFAEYEGSWTEWQNLTVDPDEYEVEEDLLYNEGAVDTEYIDIKWLEDNDIAYDTGKTVSDTEGKIYPIVVFTDNFIYQTPSMESYPFIYCPDEWVNSNWFCPID